MTEFTLDPRTTALVVIDLQRGIVATPTVPHASADVIARASDLARHFRSRQSLVVLVRVDPGPGGILFPRPITDIERPRMNPGPDWAEILPELGPEAGDVVVTKHHPVRVQWNGSRHSASPARDSDDRVVRYRDEYRCRGDGAHRV